MKQLISSENLRLAGISPYGKCLVAVSGGRDSMALAYALNDLGIECLWAHCNFGLRGDESDEDEQFVAEQSQALGIELEIKRFNTADFDATRTNNTQEAARNLRYEWFAQLLVKHGAHSICVAHHEDDQAETVLMNLLRGAGAKGLSGMAWRQGKVARPLLSTSRASIDGYLQANNLAYRDDSSNSSSKYTRNTLRNDIFPLLGGINSGFKSNVSKSAELSREAHYLVEQALEKLASEITQAKAHGLLINKELLATSEVKRSLTWKIIEQFGFTVGQVDEIIGLLDSQTGKSIESPTHLATAERKHLAMTSKTRNTQAVTFHSTEELANHDSFTIEQIPALGLELQQPGHVALLDSAKLTFPVDLRAWEAGDRFQPLGMDRSQKVSDFLTQAKVSPSQRKHVLVLCNKDGIAWIVGMRINHKFRITAQTESCTKITYDKL